MPNVRQREDFDDLVEKLLRWLPPEKVLRHIKPEERLVGLTLEQQILALPDAVLRGLSAEYVESLPPDVQDAIRQRLGKTR